MGIDGSDAFREFINGMGPGVSDKVTKNAPKYLLDEYEVAVNELQEWADKYPDPTVIPTLSDDEQEEIAEAMERFTEASRALMDVLKVVIALEIVLTGGANVRSNED